VEASAETLVLEVQTKEELLDRHLAVVVEQQVVDQLLRKDEFDKRINPASA
jgi:hypothetical protein